MFDEFPNVQVSQHPLVEDKLNRLRDRRCTVPLFRRLLHEIGMLLAYEATLDLPPSVVWTAGPISTPVGVKDDARIIDGRPPVIVPILRAGLVLADGVAAVLPDAHFGHIGLYRDETTRKNTKETRIEYLVNLPDPSVRLFILVDPMIAYGGTACRAIKILKLNNISEENIRFISLISSYSGLLKLSEKHKGVRIHTGAIDGYQQPDGGLNEKGYITPGLGDAGDRMFGTYTPGADDAV